MVRFRGKDITKDMVVRELEKFDAEYPDTNNYDNWLEDNSYKYALEHRGKLYPPKYIFSRLTGIDVSEFSGGDQTDNVFRELGFVIRNKSAGKRYWVIAPYDSTKPEIFDKAWEYDFKNGTIAVGWSSLGDISTLNEEALENRYIKAHGKDNPADRKAIWNFCHEISVGDIIIARRGLKKIIGIGEVIKLHFFDENKGKERLNYLTDDSYSNFIRVRWKEVELNFDKQVFPRFTISEIDKKKFLSLTQGKIPDEEIHIDMDRRIKLLLEQKKQIILYGPPGTGKTFNTKKYTVDLLENIIDTSKPIGKPEGSFEDIDDGYFSRLKTYVEGLPGTEGKPESSMIGYYSVSKKDDKKMGLVWISYPAKEGSLRVWLRKGEYPSEIKDMPGYIKNGWGGYPEFRVKGGMDVEKAMEFIKYAYDNL